MLRRDSNLAMRLFFDILVRVLETVVTERRAHVQAAQVTENRDILNKNTIKSKRKAMNRNWYNQKANPALNTKAGKK